MHVETIAVIGATPDGRQFALASAVGGFVTILEDVTRSRLDEGLAFVQERAGAQVAERLRSARSVAEACREADLVIETTPEDMEVKIEMFTLLDRFAKPGAIFATTSLLPIHEMAAMTFRPEKCVGFRLTGDPADPQRFEVVRAERTSQDTIDTCIAVVKQMGKDVTVICEAPAAPVNDRLTGHVSTSD